MESPTAELREDLALAKKEVATIQGAYDRLLTRYIHLLGFMDSIRNQLSLELDA